MGGRHLLAVGLMSVVATACASSAKDELDDGALKTHYTLQVGAQVPHPAPLPTQTDIFVKWHLKNGDTTTNRGFIGWDFNRDGRFEMVDVLNEDGSLQARVFDFDGDGTIDDTKMIASSK
jgi:hypothetical protein